MLRRACLMLLCSALALGVAAETTTRSILCLILTTEGASAQGNALYLKYMALQPELLRSYTPTRFTVTRTEFSTTAEGRISYSAQELEPVERYGKTVLNSVAVEFVSAPLPKVWKSAEVEIKVAELAAGGDAVQPGARAIELAARKLKLTKGRAWIESIELVSPGLIRAKVNFAK